MHFNRSLKIRSRISCVVEKKTGTMFMMKVIFGNIDVIDIIIKTYGIFKFSFRKKTVVYFKKI